MDLTLKRTICDGYTIGHLFLNGNELIGINTLEDQDRGLKQSDSLTVITSMKVFGKTAIPKGTYTIILNQPSTRFSNFQKYPWAKKYKGQLPRIENVPGFQGVLIHVGNTPENTEGCILIGQNKVKGKILNSVSTFDSFMAIISKYKNEKITITIE